MECYTFEPSSATSAQYPTSIPLNIRDDTSVQLCSAHRLQAEETTKWKEKAGKILEIVAVLTAGGTSLGDAIKLML